MKYLSLCSGIEAATVAWHHLGWEPVAFSEIEPFPSAVLAHHYPNVPNLGDMTKYKEWPDYAIDLLVGGTPCQSFSVAGLRKGLDDPRGNLMLTYIAIANRYRPQWLVWENVPGVLSSNGGRDFASLLRGLEECGYGVAYRVLDAQYVRTQRFPRAVPQRRRRVFVVGYLGSWQRAAAVLFERHGLQGNPPPSRKAGQVAPTIPSRSSAGGGLGTDFDCDGGLICMAHGQANAEIQTEHNPALTCNHEAPIVASQAVAFDWQSGGDSRGLDPKDTAQLQRCQTPAIHHGMQVRRLTPKEHERLQGFPDHYTNIPWRNKPEAPDGPRYKALGNSMACNVMHYIGVRVQQVEDIAYCGKERPESEMYEEEITFRTRVNGRATLGHKKGWYCKETKCGGKDQMAHEG